MANGIYRRYREEVIVNIFMIVKHIPIKMYTYILSRWKTHLFSSTCVTMSVLKHIMYNGHLERRHLTQIERQ